MERDHVYMHTHLKSKSKVGSDGKQERAAGSQPTIISHALPFRLTFSFTPVKAAFRLMPLLCPVDFEPTSHALQTRTLPGLAGISEDDMGRGGEGNKYHNSGIV